MTPVKGARPVHPGRILHDQYLLPLNLSAHALAVALRLPAPRINDIVRERRGVSPDTALRLARYFGNHAEFWIGLQGEFDLGVARKAAGRTIDREVMPMKVALAPAARPRSTAARPRSSVQGR